jgi:hypothetical protein
MKSLVSVVRSNRPRAAAVIRRRGQARFVPPFDVPDATQDQGWRLLHGRRDHLLVSVVATAGVARL